MSQPVIPLKPPSPPFSEADPEGQVTALWARHQSACERQRRARTEITRLRAELGAELAEVKRRLTAAGQKGHWGAFLEARGIPRATADRLVNRHLHPHPEPPPALEARPFPEDLNDILGYVLCELRPFSLEDRFRCLEALGPALGLTCRHRGDDDDLLIERPEEDFGLEDDEDDGNEGQDAEDNGTDAEEDADDAEEDADFEAAAKDRDENPQAMLAAGSSPADSTPTTGVPGGEAAPASVPRPAGTASRRSPGIANSSVRKFFRRLGLRRSRQRSGRPRLPGAAGGSPAASGNDCVSGRRLRERGRLTR